MYILLQISKDIPGIIIRVWDADGEFLLIEAADHLPNWCNPDSCCEKVRRGFYYFCGYSACNGLFCKGYPMVSYGPTNLINVPVWVL